MSPNDPKGYASLGYLKLAVKDYQGAINAFDKALYFNDEHKSDYFNTRAIAKMALKDDKGAIDDLTEAIKTKPNVKALTNRANLFRKAALYNDAVKDCNEALNILEKNNGSNIAEAIVYQIRGDVKLDMQDYTGALTDYETALTLNAVDAQAYYGRAMVKNHSGDRDGACSDWHTALNLGEKRAKQWVDTYCN